MCEEDGNVGGEGEEPGQSYQPPHIPDSPGGKGADWMHHSQVPHSQLQVFILSLGPRAWAQLNIEQPVCRHEYEGVDGDVGRDVDDVLDCPAPGQSEGPEHQDVVTGSGRHTDQYEEEVSHGQVQYQQVCGVLHLRVSVDLGV